MSSISNKWDTSQKMKDVFIKCDQIHSCLRIWPHLLKKFIMENFIFCAVGKMSVIGQFAEVSESKSAQNFRDQLQLRFYLK